MSDWQCSAFGDANQQGMEGVKLWTKATTITRRWPDGAAGDGDGANAFTIPTMG